MGRLLLVAKPPKGAGCCKAGFVRAVAATALMLPALALALFALQRPEQSPAAATRFGRQPGEAIQSLLELQSGYTDQQGSVFKVGQAIRIYAVGSSNTVWVPWLEQLHLLLSRLGFLLPLVPAKEKALIRPLDVPDCEDATEYASMLTARIGQPGWGSWGFAYEGLEGCAAGFRWIAGRAVNCRAAWGCPRNSPEPLSLSRIAADASKSDITLLSCWINDSKQFATGNTCYNHSNVSRVDTADISIVTLQRIIRNIHQLNPNVWVVVLALYPDVTVPPQVVNTATLPMINKVNRRVREGLVNESKTIFADYSFPLGVRLFQRLHFGHPNCQAAKLMANGVVDALFSAGVLARGLARTDDAPCPPVGARVHCGSLRLACCQRAALCRVLAGMRCIDYGPRS
uniref:Uncharacterized protein n=1 Tax=Alexandrium monilatum TaxID=311494 RepID=A0A7S4RG70_9DINO